jgi:D-serine deaminase-like pyridoxal phosphate-dependent protein
MKAPGRNAATTSMNRPRVLADIPTPALLLDVAALDRNIGRMAAFFAEGACRLRPHFKAHKTPEIARRQLAAGSCSGITCATVAEAEAVAGLCDDVLIANEIADRVKCERVAALARRTVVTVAVDSAGGLDEIAATAGRAGVRVGVLVDVDVGQRRCGVLAGEEALGLARRVAGHGSVELRGLMGYEGHLQQRRSRTDRETGAREAMGLLIETARLLRSSGLPCGVVSAGGTGTYDITGRIEGITEVQAGSYVLMDTDYAALGLPFEHAFAVLGTVISRPTPDRLVADCGHKSMTKDHGYPAVKDIDGASVTALNDEHAVIIVPPSARAGVGDRVCLLPSHVDPTVNLHDVFYVMDGNRVVDVWPITARGYAEQEASLQSD